MEKQEIIKLIRETLESQKFFEWYEGAFQDYITGETRCQTGISYDEDQKNIEKDIAKLFRIK